MIAIAETLPARLLAHPAVVDASIAGAVIGHGRLRPRQRAHHQLVPDRQRDKQGGGDSIDGARRIAEPNRGVDHGGDEDRDLRVAEMDVGALACRDRSFAIAFSGGVFVEGSQTGFNMMAQLRVLATATYAGTSAKTELIDVSPRYKEAGGRTLGVLPRMGGLLGADG